MTNQATAPPPRPPAPPAWDQNLSRLRAEMEALIQILPGTALVTPPHKLPDDEAVEAGFDNMPV
jgi:hypothetical protein